MHLSDAVHDGSFFLPYSELSTCCIPDAKEAVKVGAYFVGSCTKWTSHDLEALL